MDRLDIHGHIFLPHIICVNILHSGFKLVKFSWSLINYNAEALSSWAMGEKKVLDCVFIQCQWRNEGIPAPWLSETVFVQIFPVF